MKTITKLIIIFCVLTLVSIYFSIPGIIRMSKIVNINCATESANRFLSQKSNWQKIWPKIYDSSNDYLHYDKDTVQVVSRLRNTIQLMVHHRGNQVPGSLIIIPLAADSTKIEWRATIVAGINPINRIIRYRHARRINRMMVDIIRQAKTFLEKKENLYGIQIEKVSTKDTFLIATRATLPRYPVTADVYNLVGLLRKYIAEQQAIETGNPIMNVTQLDNNEYELMVALPTNKELPGGSGIFFRRMVPGNFISTEVKGGSYTVNNAFNQLQLYMEEYKKTHLAIPFQALITDRIAEPDTSKWITRIYCPSL